MVVWLAVFTVGVVAGFVLAMFAGWLAGRAQTKREQFNPQAADPVRARIAETRAMLKEANEAVDKLRAMQEQKQTKTDIKLH